MNRSQDGIFSHFTPTEPGGPPVTGITASLQKPAGPLAASLQGNLESTWNDAAVYKLNVPAIAIGKRVILNINYTADAARLYVGDKLFLDNFYNGDPMPIALWRIPADQWVNLQLKVLPYSDGLAKRLPDSANAKIEKAKAAGTLNAVTVSAEEQMQMRVTP
jgi:hypothetical protein